MQGIVYLAGERRGWAMSEGYLIYRRKFRQFEKVRSNNFQLVILIRFLFHGVNLKFHSKEPRYFRNNNLTTHSSAQSCIHSFTIESWRNVSCVTISHTWILNLGTLRTTGRPSVPFRILSSSSTSFRATFELPNIRKS